VRLLKLRRVVYRRREVVGSRLDGQQYHHATWQATVHRPGAEVWTTTRLLFLELVRQRTEGRTDRRTDFLSRDGEATRASAGSERLISSAAACACAHARLAAETGTLSLV